MTTPSGKLIGYTWANGNIASLTLNGAPLVSNIVYQPFAGPVGWILANGETPSRSYDLDGRIASDPLETIGYDTNSRASGWTLSNLNALGGSMSYGYDALNRVNSYTGSGGPISYSYDATGNRTQQIVNGTTTAYTIDPASNRDTSIGGASLGYNADGSITSKSVATLGYDATARLGSYDREKFIRAVVKYRLENPHNNAAEIKKYGEGANKESYAAERQQVIDSVLSRYANQPGGNGPQK